MSVFKSLAEEHALLLRLVDRLEKAADEPDSRAVEKDTRNLLLVLIKALEAHENLEKQVFEEESAPPSGQTGAALELVERQHFALAALSAEAAELLQGLPREDAASIRAVTRGLTRLLRRHFEDEERALWPNFNASAGRARLHRLDRLAREQIRAMENEIEGYWAAVDEYLT